MNSNLFGETEKWESNQFGEVTKKWKKNNQ